ncbi:ProS2 [Paenibacillus mucilaginosus 3016]|uniref:Proline--tRNA ligase n=1 Tax=Paenibacillus mucilaginosus 3016 TaxID=1116391 RepID=H6NE79_9BACL|nr:proline--tRNA ligase [Paenibacillus mucilaginosus]AFC33855.1 ProS2 [Paenibacillus mucilaginosus 3016]WFA22237.1 proline--tRNA ligase [Paenibacillus mucilaginosus]
MKQSTLFMPTLREVPAEAEAASHRLMLRAGLIRPLAAGIYSYLPLGRKVLRRVEELIRREMEAAGAQEVLLPAMQPAELWRESGRYGVYGPELVRLTDRHGREFALGPTHEEVITTLVRDEISSYRRLPMTLYQIQTKFRDERRPRFGLLRGREFLMKDAYSFDADWEGLDRSYRRMEAAYHRIMQGCGLRYRAVEADSGSIGGEGGTHEFMALCAVGEDTIVSCTACDYAANLEKAEAAWTPPEAPQGEVPVPDAERWHTPGVRTIAELTEKLGEEAGLLLKTLIYLADGQPAAVVVRGLHEVNEAKVRAALGADVLELADAETTQRVTGARVGLAGPVGLQVPLLVDREAAALAEGITGANEADWHLRHVVPGRDFPLERVGDYRNVRGDDACPRCGGGLEQHRGIEVGHVFKLGTKYSAKLGAVFTDETGVERPMIMGCYGIGVSRILSAVVEQHHDEQGIVWPEGLAPFDAHLIPLGQEGPAAELADRLYAELRSRGAEMLLDDRAERPGVKFKDADLIGLPVRIVIGRDAAEGFVEYKERRSGETFKLTAEEAAARVLAGRA